jgi:hypothetical protein
MLCVWAVDSIVILIGLCVGCGQHCDINCWCEDCGKHCNTESCVWAVDSIAILSGVCVGCGQHCDNEWWCVYGQWKALCY